MTSLLIYSTNIIFGDYYMLVLGWTLGNIKTKKVLSSRVPVDFSSSIEKRKPVAEGPTGTKWQKQFLVFFAA